MKKLFLILLIFISLNIDAQNDYFKIKEGSFTHIVDAVMDDAKEHTDADDKPMALFKISTENINDEERRKLYFTGNRVTEISDKVYKTGSVWIYITAEHSEFLEIRHPDYGVTRFYFPESLCDFCTYEMVLQYVPMENKIEVAKPRNTYLIITSDQDDAIIYIDDEFVGTKEVSKSFDIGTQHTWKIECNMYHTETGTVTLNDKTIISKELHPNFGYINVTTYPEHGAMVFVDGEYVGKSPCKTERLRSGQHVVKVVKEMYNSNEQTFVVTDGNTTEAKMEMAVNFVNLTISTDAESDIYVDEEFKGKGTWNGRLSEGSHYIEARKTSHETSAKNINLTVGKDENIVLEAPKPIYGFLDVSTTPIMADVYIDGKHYGTTPSVIDDILVGKHELKLEKKGYSFFAKDITIEEGETLFLEETLVIGEKIKIITDVNGDSIYVDGYYVGVSPITMNISYGTHDFKAVRNSMILEQTVAITEYYGNVRLMFNEINGHKYVDLGLPSGLKWATCNVGADYPEDYGNYYAWGETYTKTKYDYSSDYKINNKKDISGNARYDAARANWGGDWRMPTKSEFQELIDECTWKWSTQNGIDGYKIIGPNGNSIFLPSAGRWYGNEPSNVGYNSYYWSSTINAGSYSDWIYYLSFSKYSYEVSDYGNGYYGCSVRPVCSSVDYGIGLSLNKVPDTSHKTDGSISLNYNNSKIVNSKKHSLSIIGGAAMGIHYNYEASMYGNDDAYGLIHVAKAVGLEYGLIDDDDYDFFVNMMYYLPKNKRPALSFIAGKSSLNLRYGVGVCYAEYYAPASIYDDEGRASIKDGFSFGFLLGAHKTYDNNSILTCDIGMYVVGNHILFDLRLGIGLTWKKK